MRKKQWMALVLALAMLLTGCAPAAASMHLRKAEGVVGVADDGGKDVEIRENLGLYSGYGVDTEAESYAWIDLDSVKLAKLDENSDISIEKSGKKLEIVVNRGSIYFHVTEPLADDETMEIRASDLLVGIRGTCGWVTQDSVALLEGTVEVTAREQSVTISAGEMAVYTDGALEVKPLTAASVPAFVREEIAEDEKLAEAIQDTTGMDLTGADPLAPYAGVLAEHFDEVLYSEFVDLAGDGRPELVVLGVWLSDLETSPSYSDRNFKFLVFPDDPTEASDYKEYHRPLFSEEYQGLDEFSWSLVEADGRLFIGYYYIANQQPATGPYHAEAAQYYGFDSEGNWFYESAGYTVGTTGSFHGSHSTSVGYRPNVESVTQDCDLDEFTAVRAKYREVKVLAHSPDGKSLVIDAS